MVTLRIMSIMQEVPIDLWCPKLPFGRSQAGDGLVMCVSRTQSWVPKHGVTCKARAWFLVRVKHVIPVFPLSCFGGKCK